MFQRFLGWKWAIESVQHVGVSSFAGKTRDIFYCTLCQSNQFCRMHVNQ